MFKHVQDWKKNKSIQFKGNFKSFKTYFSISMKLKVHPLKFYNCTQKILYNVLLVNSPRLTNAKKEW